MEGHPWDEKGEEAGLVPGKELEEAAPRPVGHSKAPNFPAESCFHPMIPFPGDQAAKEGSPTALVGEAEEEKSPAGDMPWKLQKPASQ